MVRMAYGMCFGLSLPLTTSMIAEVSTLQYRGKLLVLANFMTTVGKVCSVLLAICFMDNDL